MLKKLLFTFIALVVGLGTVAVISLPTAASATAPHASVMSRECHGIHVVDHRGAVNKHTDEDTIAAFKRGFKLSARHPAFTGGPSFETDIQPGKGQRIWTMHDRTVSRTTNGRGVVSQMTAAQMERLRTPAGQHVPSLWQDLQLLVQHPRAQAQLESKVYGNNWHTSRHWNAKQHKWVVYDPVQHLVNMVIKLKLVKRVHFSSYNLHQLVRINKAFQKRHVTPQPLQWIGNDTAMPIKAAEKAGLKPLQFNVTWAGAEDKMHDGSPFATEAINRGFLVSARSFPNGTGDNGRTWTWEINHHVAQIVTDDIGRYYDWCNSL